MVEVNTEHVDRKSINPAKKDFKEVVCSLDALIYYLNYKGPLNPSINRNKLIEAQTLLVLRDLEGVLPEIDELKVEDRTVKHPDYEKHQTHKIRTLEGLSEKLYDLGKEKGWIKDI